LPHISKTTTEHHTIVYRFLIDIVSVTPSSQKQGTHIHSRVFSMVGVNARFLSKVLEKGFTVRN